MPPLFRPSPRGGSALAAVAAFFVGFLFLVSPPSPTARTQIFRGVYLTVEAPEQTHSNGGKVMIVEAHWDAPGVKLVNRPYSYRDAPADPAASHYRLEWADWGLLRSGAAALVNTSIYYPAEFWRSLPGFPVWSLETIVVDGQPSHVDPHSYLLYWDSAMEVHLQATKPPDQASLERAVLGVGLQGVQVLDGLPRYQAIGDEESSPRTFLGVDPVRKILYLIAFEDATARFMIDRAVESGVVFGGQLDSGGASHLLVGWGASETLPHTGFRHWRPLGSYLLVFAEPLEQGEH